MYTGKMGYSLTAFVEGDATSGLASLPANFSNKQGALGVDPSDDDIIACVTNLDNSDVPDDGRFFYVSPPTHSALLKIDKFTRQEYVGQSDAETAVKKARVGMVYNAPVYKSTLANNTPAAASQSYSWFCHKRGVALIMQLVPTVRTQWIILEDGWGVLTTCIYQFAERLIAPKTLGGGSSDDTFNVALQGA
jgi:hypothetical protein